jgi:hypothetical protein
MVMRFLAKRIDTPDPAERTCVDPEEMRTYLWFDRGGAELWEHPTIYLERGFGMRGDGEDYGHGPITVEVEGPEYRSTNGIAAAELRRDSLTLRFTAKAAKRLEDDGVEICWQLNDQEFGNLAEEVRVFFAGCRWFVDHCA